MLGDLLLPDPRSLNLEALEIIGDTVVIKVASTCQEAICPGCQKIAYRVHSRYLRKLDDLPCGERKVQLYWKTRRFFCDNYACSCLTFCEHLPQLARPHARKTQRLQKQQIQIGFEMGGEGGKRLTQALRMPVSGDQILRSVSSMSHPDFSRPRVLGVDDWAMKKGHVYGTILIDLEKRCVIDLLPDRKPETLATWLSKHPGIEMISRDRGKEYIEGIRLANQECIEIADRFHLLKNMVEAVQRFCERCASELILAARQNSSEPKNLSACEASKELEPQKPTDKVAEEKEKTPRQALFKEVKSLNEQGLSQRAIAQKTGLDRRTVNKYIRLSEVPQKRQRYTSASKSAPFLEFIQQRWEQHVTVQQLLVELQAKGFTGSYSSISRAIHTRLGVQNIKKSRAASPKAPRYSPKEAAWAIVQPESALKDWQKVLCQKFCTLSPLAAQVRILALSFREMITGRQPDKLDDWLIQAESCEVVELVHFAEGLRSDYKAVRAALTYTWSNGQVEGQVNRLKLIKRQMYGRAGFQLLRSRVIGPAPAS